MFDPEESVGAPGSYRTIAVTLQSAISRVLTSGTNIQIKLVVDEEVFSIVCKNGHVDVQIGPILDPAVMIETSFEPFMAVGDGRITFEEFIQSHCRVEAALPENITLVTQLIPLAIWEVCSLK